MSPDMYVITFNNQLFLFSLLVFTIWISLGLSEFCVMRNLRYLDQSLRKVYKDFNNPNKHHCIHEKMHKLVEISKFNNWLNKTNIISIPIA